MHTLHALNSVCQELHHYTPWKQFIFQTESSFWPLALLLGTSISNMEGMTVVITSAYVNLRCLRLRLCHDVTHRSCQKSPQCLKPRKKQKEGVSQMLCIHHVTPLLQYGRAQEGIWVGKARQAKWRGCGTCLVASFFSLHTQLQNIFFTCNEPM